MSGPSSGVRPKTLPPFFDICSIMLREIGWKANAGAKPGIVRIGFTISVKILIISFMRVASFLNVTVLNLRTKLVLAGLLCLIH
jgi:uncharacterized membrane protein YtjA (UPF0391 family)